MAGLETRIEGERGQPSSRRNSGGEGAGIALAAFSAVAFGTLAISAKSAYDVGAGFIPLLAARFAMATVLLALFHVATRRSLAIGSSKIVKLLLLGGFGYAFEAALFFAALERAPAGVVGLVFYSYPLWTTLIGFATGLEPFRSRTILALALGSIGVALVFTLPGGGLAGPLLALGAAVAVAVYFILMQVVLRNEHASQAAFWTTLGGAATLFPASLIARQPLPAEALLPTVGLGIASAIAFVAAYAAVTRIGSARTAIAAMLEPITTLILGAAFLSEDIGPRVVVGAVLVVSALPLLATGQRERLPAADTL